MQDSEKEIKKRIIEKYDSIDSLSYRMKEKFEFDDFHLELTAWIALKKPSMLYYEDNRTIRISNGTVFREYKKENRIKNWNIDFAYSTTSRIFGVDRVYRMLKSNESNVKFAGVEEVDGKECYFFSIKKENEDISLWVNKETLLPVKMLSEAMNITVEFEYFDFKINSVDEKLFEKKPNAILVRIERFNVPENKSIELFKKRTGFPLLLPNYTGGFKFHRISTHHVGENECVNLFYFKEGDFHGSQDFNNFVIIECLGELGESDRVPTKVTFDNTTAELYSLNGGNLMKFRKDEVFVYIFGELDKEETIKVAESLKKCEL